MDDIVERLLSEAHDWDCVNNFDEVDMHGLLAGAATEIETLRARNTALQEEVEHLRAEAIEQARIIGMGAERELALLAQVQEFRQVQRRLMNDLQACKDALAQWDGHDDA